jgi:hypothetical protein
MTYRDAIDHVIDLAHGLPEEADQRMARSIVQDAYRDVGSDRRWRYLQKHDRITLDAAYTTGTVTYDHTGGSVERELTLATGTWPDWARYGRISIAGYDPVYKISERESDTVVQLDTNFNPGADITDATAYTLFRSVYHLPADLVWLDEIHDENGQWSSGYIVPDEWLRLERRSLRAGRPFSWTVIGAPDNLAQMAVCTYGYASASTTLDFLYTRRPRPIRFDGYRFHSSVGDYKFPNARISDVTGTAVTFTDFTTDPDTIGAILRWSHPGVSKVPRGLDDYDAYPVQHVIIAQPDGATLTVDSSVHHGTHGSYFVISDPVDFPEYLIGVFKIAMQWHYLLRTDPKRAMELYPVYLMARRQARAMDSMVPSPVGEMWHGWQSPAWAFISATITPGA